MFLNKPKNQKRIMTFETEKQGYLNELYKPDRSKKGGVDMEIAHIINLINDHKDWYTTSSCAGRIDILRVPLSGRKDEAEWLYVSHAETRFEDLKPALERIRNESIQEPIWFRQEAPIFHIATRTVKDAQNIVDAAKFVGFKRSGIMATNKRIMVELTSTEFMDTIIAKDGQVLVSDEYLKILVEEANKKLARARLKAEKLFVQLKTIPVAEKK